MFQSFDPPADADLDRAARLDALRGALPAAGVDALLVPRADAYQNEMVPPSEARLAWLTGFTGSAGLAAVLPETAALLVDGRYTLQAAAQVGAGPDGEGPIQVVATHQTTPSEWLRQRVTGGMRVGFDPWLHGRDEIERLERAVAEAGGRLVALSENPVDRLWADRPAPPAAPARLHPEVLAGETAAAKRLRLGAALTEAGCEAAVLTRPDAVCWLLNIRGGDLARVPVVLGFAVLHADGRVALVTDPARIGPEVRDALGEDVAVVGFEALGPALDALAERRVRLDRRTCPLWIANRLDAAGAVLDWDEDPCLLPKARKNAAELAGMRDAHVRDGLAMVRFLHWLDTQGAAGARLDEIAVVERLEACRRDTGQLLDIAFDTICGAGPNGAIVHYRVDRSTDRALCPGEPLLVDSGGQYPDGTTDVTRTLVYGGGPPPEGFAGPYTLVLKGMIAIARARWPRGLAGRDLDALARIGLWQAGFDYDHGTGHGVGAALDVHEGPIGLSRRSGAVALEPGMILSDEPGHYRTGAFGIRLENLLAVREATVPEGGDRAMLGFETLTLVPIDTRPLERSLLAPEEIGWLDAYHARVRETLAPDLPPEAAAWLERATAPLG